MNRIKLEGEQKARNEQKMVYRDEKCIGKYVENVEKMVYGIARI